MNIFDLAAKLSLDKTEYDKGLDEGESKAKNFGKAISTGLQSAAKIGAAAVTTMATAVVGLGTKLVGNIKDLGEYGEHIDKMSQKLGISATAYQEWDHILQQNGANVDSLQASMLKMAKAVEAGSDAFEQLGISAEELDTLTQEELFARVIEGLQGMSEGAERSALAAELLGKGSVELAPLLNITAEETENLRQEAHDLGAVLSDETIAAAADFDDAMGRLNKTFEGLKNHAVEQFLPAVNTILDGITALGSGDAQKGFDLLEKGVDEFIDKLSEQAPKMLELGGRLLLNFVEAIGKNLPKLFEKGGEIVGDLINGILSDGSLQKLVQAALDVIKALAKDLSDSTKVEEFVASAIKIVGDLADMLVDPETISALLDAAIGIITGLFDAFMKPETIDVFTERTPEIIDKLINALIDGAFKMIDAALALLDKLIDSFDNPETWLKFLVAAEKIVVSLGKALVKIAFKLKETGEHLLEKLLDGARDAFGTVKDFLSDLIDKMGEYIFGTSLWNKFKEWGHNVIDGFTSGIKERFEEVKDFIMSIFDPFGWFSEGGFISDAWNSLTGGISDAYTSVKDWALGTEKVSEVSPVAGLTGRAEAPMTVNVYAQAQRPSELYAEWTSEAARRTYLEA